MSSIAQTVMPPAEWPKATVGGVAYTVKASLLAEYELSKLGRDIGEVRHLIRNPTDPHNFSLTVDFWRVFTAHEFTLSNPPRPVPSAAEWIAAIEKEENIAETIGAMALAVSTAFAKWWLERKKPAAAAPAPTPAAETPTTEPQTPLPVN